MSAEARAMQDGNPGSSEAAAARDWALHLPEGALTDEIGPLCSLERLRQLDEACGGAGFGGRR
ncbi:MAG TPA: hypothetical protein VF727_17610 [Allosphingosinicella sp.]|jgi:hypothetical protein